VACDETADDFGLTSRLKRRLVSAFLARRDQRDDFRSVDQKILQPRIDLVETPP
jgi:hypothetical protein